MAGIGVAAEGIHLEAAADTHAQHLPALRYRQEQAFGMAETKMDDAVCMAADTDRSIFV